MSGGAVWSPMQITREEFEEVVRSLEASPRETLKYIEPPSWVDSKFQWDIWIAEYCFDIPSTENRKFQERIRTLEVERKKYEINGDEAKLAEVLSELTNISMEMSQFVKKHRKPHVWKRETT